MEYIKLVSSRGFIVNYTKYTSINTGTDHCLKMIPRMLRFSNI